ncbi:hypothetical protein GGR54DRAFT_632376 [Hypoxylon sp. NC1633]|nr:hypothetical protein GGR54DRAFT_632376 [Hypoxylon sp. NC1633]
MPAEHLHGDSPAAGEATSAPKRRKIRKGTQSCWECKRRKIRCSFAAPTDAICDGCKSRRTKCIGQEFQDDAALSGRKVGRLGRMESLVEQLVEQSCAEMHGELRQDRSDQDETTRPAVSRVPSNLGNLSSALLAAWPSQHDLDLILSIPIGVSVLFHGVVCRPYSKLFAGPIESPRNMLRPPSQQSYPVIIARRLLLLAALLQGIPPCSVDEPVGLSSDYRDIMSRVFDTATRLVTSNDEYISSLEGIECVMIESMYLNNAGNLRRAWLANRRAMSLAQMMGLHVGLGSNSPNMILENETRHRIDPDYMWFRLVVTDRYLSLMLGLPQGSLDNVFPNLEAPESCFAVERLERVESVASNLILQRNSTERTDLAATHKIDKMLQDAAALMPPQWWLMTTDLTAISGNDAKAFEKTIRLMTQFAYYHLLVQLHLPYMMLSSSAEPSYDYSKMTAANASRAIVTQFVSFRKSCLAPAYCRGVDFVAFIASTTICIAHIEARRQHIISSAKGKGVTVLQSLRHQRQSDRALLERTLEVMETMAQRSSDVVAQKISSILQPLLAIENNSFKGGCYHVYASSDTDKQESRCLGDTSEETHALHIQIPYFGTVQIEHRPALPDIVDPAQIPSEELPWNPPVVLRDESVWSLDPDKEGEAVSSARPTGYEIGTAEPVNADWQTVPSYLDIAGPSRQSGLVIYNQGASSFDTYEPQDTYLLVPGLAADVDDWALQGVDMALFSNLTQGPADPTHTQ